MDFFQNGTITTLHKLCQRPIEEMETELKQFSAERPMALILPSLYSELEGPALPKIVEELKLADDVGVVTETGPREGVMVVDPDEVRKRVAETGVFLWVREQ